MTPVVYLSRTSDLLPQALFALLLHLLACDAAVSRHGDVDRPRNLAQSVTVERELGRPGEVAGRPRMLPGLGVAETD